MAITVEYLDDVVPGTRRIGSVEVQVPTNASETDIEITVPRAALAKVAFSTGFEGSSVTVSEKVHWASGDEKMPTTLADITISAGQVVPLPADDYYAFDELVLTVPAQTSDRKMMLYFWRF